MLKLYIDRAKCRLHVRVKVAGDDELDGDLADFEGFAAAKDGCYGVVRIRRDSSLPTVVHELAHAAVCFVEDHWVGGGIQKDADTRNEAIAYSMESLFKQFMENRYRLVRWKGRSY